MKFFTNRRLWQKMLIVILVVIMISFVCAKPVSAAWVDIVGTIFNPIMQFLVSIGDVMIDFMQDNILGLGDAFISIDRGSGFWSTVLGIIAAIVVIAVAVIAAIFTTTGKVALVMAIMSAITSSIGSAAVVGIATKVIASAMLPGSTVVLPQIKISPQEIFTNQIAMLDVNFVNPHDSTDFQIPTATDADGNRQNTIAQDLRDVISSWYTSLRNVTLVGLMIVLLYVGIRILLSSVASDKAKYKQMLRDWVIALCILFFLHYIMAFSISIVEQITKGFASMLGTYVDPEELEEKSDEEVTQFIAESVKGSILEIQTIEDAKVWNTINDMDPSVDNYYSQSGILGPSGSERVNWIITNSMSQARMNYQLKEDLTPNDTKDDNYDTTAGTFGWGIAYLALVCFTLYFMFVYFKRLIYMAFLTMISPLIALTYPIDKMNDGQAQAFNTWLKEFLFNLLLQPMHLILYTVLIGSAMQLAARNILYVIVAFAFMVPAEKLLRKFFGFEKASTPGALGGAAGAALAVTGVNKLANLFKGKSSSDEKSSDDVNGKEKEIRQKDDFDEFSALGGGASNLVGSSQPRIVDTNQSETSGGEVENLNPSGSENSANTQGENNTGGILNSSGTGSVNSNRIFQGGTTNSARLANKYPLNKRRRSIKRAIGSASRNYWMAQGRKLKRKGGLAGGLKRLGRFASGAVTGATAATAVGVASLITGDPSKIASNMAAGATAGYTLGKELPSTAYNALGAPGTLEALKKGYYGSEEYGYKQSEKQKKELMKDLEFRQKLYDKYDRETVKTMLKKGGEIEQLINYGVEDPEDIMAAHELMKNNIVGNYEDAAATARLAKRVGDLTTMKQKDRDDWEKTFRTAFSERYGEGNADRLTRDTVEKINQFNNIRFKK